MKTMLRCLLSVATGCVAAPASAGPAADSLAECLAASATADDRRVFLRLAFSALSQHPDVQDLATRSSDEAAIQRDGARSFERLIRQACSAQARATFREGGVPGLTGALEGLGPLAFDVMAHPEVTAAMVATASHLDVIRIYRSLTDHAPEGGR